jgi:predicted N-acetyltransferase YhbS
VKGVLTSPVTIREARASDAPAIAPLLGELGYPAASAEVVDRLAQLGNFQRAVAFVAERNGVVAGVATVHAFPSIHAATLVAWLTTLVVDSQLAGQGIGKQLVRAAEEWAREAGATRLSLTSGVQRTEAHAFYEHLGYKRTGVRLTRDLARAGDG